MKRGPQAPHGSSQASFLLRMDRALSRFVVRSAKAAGITRVEWIRQLIRREMARGGSLFHVEQPEKRG